MKNPCWPALLLAVWASNLACATVEMPPSADKADALKGELLAVSEDRLWLRNESGVKELPLASVSEVRVQRHSFNGRKAFTWAMIGAIVSGVALTAACASVEDGENCGAVGLVFGGLWLGTGALAARSVEASSRIQLRPVRPADLRPFARFPQGPPQNVDLLSLGPPAPEKR
jgi:hypothetical protein